jgi:anti-anti-sigma regulatory factor
LSRVIASQSGDVVIDMAEAEFIDTATVRVLAVGQQLLADRGRRLTFRSPSRLTARVLHLFGLTDLIEAVRMSLAVDVGLSIEPAALPDLNDVAGSPDWLGRASPKTSARSDG